MSIRIKYILLVFLFIFTITYTNVLSQDVMLIASETVGGSTLDFSEGDVKLIELNPTLNSSWSDTVMVDSLGQMVLHSSIISIEDSIVVPAGNFTNCALVRTYFTQETDTLMIWNYWYAENVGEIYFENSFGGSVQLLSYSIQGGNGYYPIEIGNYWQFDTGDTIAHTVISKETKEGHLCYRIEKSSQSTYWIWIREATSTDLSNENTIKNYELYQNYPNPFNPLTTIKYSLPKSDFVTIKIYNLAGQEIETLINRHQTSGEHQAKWIAEGFPSGIYFYRLQAGECSETKKLILQK